jgi:hypothetical protein
MGAGIEVGVMSFNTEGKDTLTLSTKDKPVLTCTPR